MHRTPGEDPVSDGRRNNGRPATGLTEAVAHVRGPRALIDAMTERARNTGIPLAEHWRRAAAQYLEEQPETAPPTGVLVRHRYYLRNATQIGPGADKYDVWAANDAIDAEWDAVPPRTGVDAAKLATRVILQRRAEWSIRAEAIRAVFRARP